MSFSSQSLKPSISKSQTQETISQPTSSGRVGLKTKPHLLVRTDSKTRTLDSFFSHPASSYSSIDSESSINPVYKKPKMSEVPLIARYHTEPIVLEQEDEVDESFTESQCSDSDREINELDNGSKRDIHQPNELNSDGFEMIDQELNCIDENRGDGIDSGDPSLHDSQPPKLIHYVAPDGEIDEDAEIESTSDDYENKDTLDTPVLRPFVTVELDSVLYLREEIVGKRSKTATAILHNHTFVGCFDTHLALIQHNTSLLVIEVPIISKDFMYQIALYGFSNFGVIPLDPGLSVFELLSIGLEQCKDEFKSLIEERGREIIVKEARELLVGMRLMLEEYFSILIDEEGTLTGIPVFIPGYMPNAQKLAIFLAELGLKVDYSEERECFRDIANVLSDFYSFTGIGDDQTEAEYYHCVEHFLFAELSHSIGLSEWIEMQKPGSTGSPCIREIANLQELYKIFERC